MSVQVFDPRVCTLGEGPLWHPRRQQLFWFDIVANRLLSRVGEEDLTWQFHEHVSAAGWLDDARLLIASETRLFTFDLASCVSEEVCALEADNPVTRSNDGRADPWGGFWIGTMGKRAENGAGAIYRYFKGELRVIAPDITVSNAICFAPDRSCAYYTDTVTGQVQSVALHPDTGWPEDEPVVHLDLTGDRLNPDGAITDANGNLWIAQWGAGRVACYTPTGTLVQVFDTGSSQTTCPAFGGPDFTDLYITSASINVRDDELRSFPNTGMTFCVPNSGRGMPEPQVIL